MARAEPAGGDILVYARIRDPEARTRLRQLLDDLPGERIDGSLYEVFTKDWDEGLWEEDVARMEEIIDQATDTLIFWRIVEGKLVRTCIAGRFV
jgi:hypothetical protein